MKLKQIALAAAAAVGLMIPLSAVASTVAPVAAHATPPPPTGCDGLPASLLNVGIESYNTGDGIGVLVGSPYYLQYPVTDTLSFCYEAQGTLSGEGGYGIAYVRDNNCYNHFGSGCWLEDNPNYSHAITSTAASAWTIHFQCLTQNVGSGWFELYSGPNYFWRYQADQTYYDEATGTVDYFYQGTGSGFCT